MAWRKPRTAAGVPEQLCRFVVSEWPSCCPYGSLGLWRQACLDWLADATQEDDGRMLPFGEHGDFIDVLRVSVETHEQLVACELHWSPAEYRGPAG
jgi:hypothetical protein